MLITVLALIACAFAPSFQILSAALLMLGIFNVSGQIILPLSGDLASNETRGRIVGIVSSGITAGILFSRLLSGIVAEIWDWRGIYIMAAILNLIMVVVISRKLPYIPARSKIPYSQLLIGVFTSLKRYPKLKGISIKKALTFYYPANILITVLFKYDLEIKEFQYLL